MVVNPAPLGAVPENVSRAPRGMKSPCTRSQMRRNPDSRERLASPGCEPSLTLDDLPDELVLHALTHLAFTEVVPGGLEPDDATLRPGSDAVVIGPSSRAARLMQHTSCVSRRWQSLVQSTRPWQLLHSMQDRTCVNWDTFRQIPRDRGGLCWAASSTTREEGKQDKWHTCELPCGGRTVMLERKCSDEGISYDVVRWVGCLQGMHHPSIAAVQVVHCAHDRETGTTLVHAGFEYADTSLQKIVYKTLERTSHTVMGTALPELTLRSFMYQLLSALAYSHARGVPHGNLAPYRVLAKTLDEDKGQYLLKLADFGFSPPNSARCNEELPIRPSRASPELHQSQTRKRYGAPNDLWALGTVFAEVACGNRDPNVYMMIQELESTSEEVFASNLPMLSVDARDLLRKLMREEPTERITAAAALGHRYFEGIHEQCEVVGRHLPLARPPPPEFLELSDPQSWAPGLDFLARQDELNPRMWAILFDWLSVVSFKFKFVPRSLQLACDFMRRYMMEAEVARKRLQLVGIGALCLACKHEEVMIPNMNDFIFICDNAYSLQELMEMETEMLNTLNLRLNMPVAHDHMQSMLQSFAIVPEHPDGEEPSLLCQWCECLTLIGLAHFDVAVSEPSSLARCVAVLGGIIGGRIGVCEADAGGIHCAPGSRAAGISARSISYELDADPEISRDGGFDKSADLTNFLRKSDAPCLEALVAALETALVEQREMLLKNHPHFVELDSISSFVEKFKTPIELNGERCHVRTEPERAYDLIDEFYPVEKARKMKLMAELPTDTFNKRKANLRGMTAEGEHVFNVAVLTLAIASRVLEYVKGEEKAAKGERRSSGRRGGGVEAEQE